MSDLSATAIAHPNIAFIKYWGNRDDILRLPVNGSLSMNLAELHTESCVSFDPALSADRLILNGKEVLEQTSLRRVNCFLDIVRGMAGVDLHAMVTSKNNFPVGAGIASSAAAFAALAMAASQALGIELLETELSRLARRGSGSACRSIPPGFVEWQKGEDERGSYAFSIAPVEHWDITDCIAIVQKEHKQIGSTDGHTLAPTSPLQRARVEDTPRRLSLCRRAILDRDFLRFAEVIELDSNIMHSVMMTSTPPLFYWQPESLVIMNAVRQWRSGGIPVAYTLDAGSNVHVLCPRLVHEEVVYRLEKIPGVIDVITSGAGNGAKLLE